MSSRGLLFLIAVAVLAPDARADEALYRYEGDVHPLDESAGWLGSPCESPCSEFLEAGHLVFLWPEPGENAQYTYPIVAPGASPPPTLWVEWRFRSNHPLGPIFTGCDGAFTVNYRNMGDLINMYGDATISNSGDDYVTGMDIDEFHTYRYESLDGVAYSFSVDGLVFVLDSEDNPGESHYLQMRGRGGCTGDSIPNQKHEWDFVRFGTIAFGERIIASDPPSGYLDPAVYSDLDRFTVTFDSANYVYIDDITVEVTGGVAPTVIQTRRRETDDVDTVEILLDGPLPLGEATRFILDDGQVTNVVSYCLGRGPYCGAGCCSRFRLSVGFSSAKSSLWEPKHFKETDEGSSHRR